MLGNVYGLDLGTYEIKIFDKKKDRIWREKDSIAMKKKRYVYAVGNEAYEMFEKAPDDIQVIFPMKNGVIAHFDDMQYLLGTLLGSERRFGRDVQFQCGKDRQEFTAKEYLFYPGSTFGIFCKRAGSGKECDLK